MNLIEGIKNQFQNTNVSDNIETTKEWSWGMINFRMKV